MDTVATKPVKKVDSAGHELLIGGDIFHPILNQFTNNRYGTEIAIDYYHLHEIYYVIEGGMGGSVVNYNDLKYNTSNEFARIGMNRAIVPRERRNDWDLMLIGFRLAAAPIHRGPATFTVMDSVWGNSNGSLAAKDYTAYWFELVGGMRVELFKGIFAGWTLRGKFILNDKVFKQLSPLYVEGYGSGDKNVVFDFNIYISYAIRWKRRVYK